MCVCNIYIYIGIYIYIKGDNFATKRTCQFLGGVGVMDGDLQGPENLWAKKRYGIYVCNINIYIYIWVFPKIGVGPPNHPF